MEIRLGRMTGSSEGKHSVEFIDEISPEEYDRLQSAIGEIYQFKNNRRLLKIVLINDEEIDSFLKAAFENFLQKSRSPIGVTELDLEDAFLQCNRLLLNYLSSFRTYVDHSQTFLSRAYGKHSEEFKKFDSTLASSYDNHFVYRFFYKLRNYAQHCGIPISKIGFSSSFDKGDNTLHGHLSTVFNKTTLLKQFDGWGKFKSELEGKEENIELRPMRIEMTEIINSIHFELEQITLKTVGNAAKYIKSKTGHLLTVDKTVHIFFDVQTGPAGKINSYVDILIPFEEIDEILGAYNS